MRRPDIARSRAEALPLTVCTATETTSTGILVVSHNTLRSRVTWWLWVQHTRPGVLHNHSLPIKVSYFTRLSTCLSCREESDCLKVASTRWRPSDSLESIVIGCCGSSWRCYARWARSELEQADTCSSSSNVSERTQNNHWGREGRGLDRPYQCISLELDKGSVTW